jgi:hypothetical protein
MQTINLANKLFCLADFIHVIFSRWQGASLPQSSAKCTIGDRDESPEIFILLNRKWSVGIAHPTF